MNNKIIKTLMIGLASLLVASCSPSSSTQNEDISYNVSLKYINGEIINDASISIFDSDNKLISEGKTSIAGNYNFDAKNGNYRVEVNDLPLGYYLIDQQLEISNDNPTLEIVASSKPITGEVPEGTIYNTKDLIYDFGFENTENKYVQLSKTLEKKKLVVINFWYKDCYWCNYEFPILNQAYEQYMDDVEVFALSVYDSLSAVTQFQADNGLIFEMGRDDINLDSAFNKSGYPYTVFVDRYGRIDDIEHGAITKLEQWTNKFDKYLADDYLPSSGSGSSENPSEDEPIIPDVTMPSSEEIELVVNGDGFNGKYYPETNEEDAKYSWPFVIDNEKSAIKPSNTKIDNSYAIVYLKFHLEKDQVIAFDYFSSTEEGYDNLYVLMNGEIINTISGISTSWETSFAYVAIESGDYVMGFCYMKDSENYEGDDTVYLRNFRYLTLDDITTPTYLIRPCAYGDISRFTEQYEYYITPVYNELDGYYHVEDVNGPLLLANFLFSSQFSNYSLYDYAVNKYFVDIDGVDYTNEVISYSSIANSTDKGYVPVDEKVKQLLITLTSYLSIITHDGGFVPYDHQYLETCNYINAYGTNGKEYENPVIGLTFKTAIKASLGDQNFATFTHVVMPRGLFFKFTAGEAGVYQFNTKGTNETECWIYNEQEELILESEDIILHSYIASETPDPNFYTWVYLNQGESLYIRAAFYDLYLFETLQLNIELVGQTYSSFEACSPGYFTTTVDEQGNMTSTIISTGIDVSLGDDGYYHQLLSDGTLGSIIYADFANLNQLFNYTLQEMNKIGAFNLSVDENGNAVENGIDYTSIVNKYINNQMIIDDGETFGTIPVDQTLMLILQGLMDKYTFPGVNNSWLKLCYYFHHYGK